MERSAPRRVRIASPAPALQCIPTWSRRLLTTCLQAASITPLPKTPPVTHATQNFVVQWDALFLATTAGTYNFTTTSDDGSLIVIGAVALLGFIAWLVIRRH